MKKNLPVVKLADGKEATSFVPELEGKLAIVHLSVLQLLIANLTRVNFKDIKENFSKNIIESDDLVQMVSIAKAEVAFHETVNLIQQYTHDQQHPELAKEETAKTEEPANAVAERAPE